MEAPTSQLADRSLIHAALGVREAACAAWESWLAGGSLNDASPAAFSVLPAVSRNFDRLGIEHPTTTRLRGLYRYSWTQGQIALRDLVEVHAALSDAGVRAVVRRGAPTTERALGDPAAIVSDQTDLLVSPDNLDHTAEILGSLGWTPPRTVPPKGVRSAFAWLPFENPRRRRVAIHWRSFPPASPLACDEGILRRAVPHGVQGIEVLVPDPTDHLLLLCLREPLLAPVERLRWEVELCGVLSNRERSVDEAALFRRAVEGSVSVHCAEVLSRLGSAHGTALPGMRIPTLPRADPTEPPAWRAKRTPRSRPGRIASALAGAVERYGDWCHRESRARTPWGFFAMTLRFYAYEWESGGAREMATAAVRRWGKDSGDLAREAP